MKVTVREYTACSNLSTIIDVIRVGHVDVSSGEHKCVYVHYWFAAFGEKARPTADSANPCSAHHLTLGIHAICCAARPGRYSAKIGHSAVLPKKSVVICAAEGEISPADH